jgi:hypothetical protein
LVMVIVSNMQHLPLDWTLRAIYPLPTAGCKV